MRRCIVFLILVLSVSPAAGKLRVFTCEPEWAALVEELAGKSAEVFSATTARQDPHHVQARPALIARLRQADLAICTGAELEIGWLPMLQRRANNGQVVAGAPGYLEAASVVPLLEKPERLDRADGDVHASGNPHIHLDPHNIARVADAVSERLIALDPGNADAYRAKAEDFRRRWQAAIARWEERAHPLEGMRVVVTHTDWLYLERWLGLKRVAALEPKPGVPPSSRHLAEVLAQAKAQSVPVVLYAAHQDSRGPDWLASRSSLRPIPLPYTVGGSERASDLFGLFDDTLDRLLEARR